MAAVLGALLACVATADAAPVGAATSHTITSTRSGASRSAAGEAIDLRVAREAGLRRSDFPAGWTSSPGPAQTMGSACPGVTAAKIAVSAQTRSREFRLDDSATADGAIYVYPDTATSVRSFAQLASHRTTACLVRVLRESVGFQLAAQGATLDSLRSRVLNIAPVGDEHSAHLVTIHLSAGATKATAYADVIFVRVGRAVAAFSLGSVGQMFDPALETTLAKAVADRLAPIPGQVT
ncbi:MAG: hypothetical protein ACTHMY_24735 [Solirubrobacteraceae bacterium]